MSSNEDKMDRVVPGKESVSAVQSALMDNDSLQKGKRLESRLHRFRPPPLEIRDPADQRVPTLPNAYVDFNNGESSVRPLVHAVRNDSVIMEFHFLSLFFRYGTTVTIPKL